MIYVLRILLNHTKKVMEEGEEKNISKILGQSIFQWIIYFAFFFFKFIYSSMLKFSNVQLYSHPDIIKESAMDPIQLELQTTFFDNLNPKRKG